MAAVLWGSTTIPRRQQPARLGSDQDRAANRGRPSGGSDHTAVTLDKGSSGHTEASIKSAIVWRSWSACSQTKNLAWNGMTKCSF